MLPLAAKPRTRGGVLLPGHKNRVRSQPGSHRRTSLAARLRGIAIVAREAIKTELQHDFCRTRRPGALPFHVFKPFEKAADVEQESDEFGSDRIECLPHTLARRNDAVRQVSHAAA